MNLLFAVDPEEDYDDIVNLLHKSCYIDNVYVCNTDLEIAEVIEQHKVHAYSIYANDPDDFGTIAFQELISYNIPVGDIIVFSDNPVLLGRTHTSAQCSCKLLDVAMINDLMSYFEIDHVEDN